MQFPVQQFPILTPDQMNPFNAALKQGLETYQNVNKAAYQPQQLQADILSKAAYATYTPYGYLSKAISDPLIFASMNPQQRQQVLGMLSGIPTNPMEGLNSFGQGGQQNKLSQLWNKITGGQQQAPQAQPQPLMQQAPSAPQDQSGMPQEFGSVNKASPELIQDVAMNGNNAYNQKPAGIPSDNDQVLSAYIKAFPNSPLAEQHKLDLERQETQQKASIQSEQRLKEKKEDRQEKNLDKYQEEAEKFSADAISYDKLLDEFHKHYSDSTLKGPLLGRAAHLGESSAQARNIAAQLQSATASKAFGNRVTNAKLVLAETMKINEKLKPEAEKGRYASFKIANQRDMELGNFVQYAIDHGVTDRNKIINLYNNYNKDLPTYSVQNKDVVMHPENLGKYPEYIDARIKNKSFHPITTENTSDLSTKGQQMAAPEGSIWMMDKAGNRVPVHRSRVQEAQIKYGLRKT